MSSFRELTNTIFEETKDTMLALRLAGVVIDNGFAEEEDTTFRELTRVIYKETKDAERSLSLPRR